MSSKPNDKQHRPQYVSYSMPRTRYPHLPTRPLYEGVSAPQSRLALLTINQINRFYDADKSIETTRWRLKKAGLEPVAFGPYGKRSGQPPMLFRAGEVRKALAEVDANWRQSATLVPVTPPTASNTYTAPVATTTETAPAPADEDTQPLPPLTPEWQHAAHINFNAIVDDESCDDLLQKIDETVQSGAKELVVWISSEGGSLFAALGVYDRLRYLQRTQDVVIHTVATGYVLSAGMLLLAAGAQRYALPHTIFMLHEPYQMPWESGEDAKVLVTEVQERAELHELSIRKIAHIFYERDPRPQADYESWLDFFRVPSKKYFGAMEALDWGLVEGVF